MLHQNAATCNLCVCGKLHGQDSRNITPKSYATCNSERFGPSQVRTGLCACVWPSLSAQAECCICLVSWVLELACVRRGQRCVYSAQWGRMCWRSSASGSRRSQPWPEATAGAHRGDLGLCFLSRCHMGVSGATVLGAAGRAKATWSRNTRAKATNM